MGDNEHRIVIIGGGITGLSAAHYVKKLCNERGVSARISLVEKDETFGGRIHTYKKDGFIIEKGPDSFLARKLPMIELVKELGLEDQLTGTNPEAKKTYVLRQGKLHRMPPGLMLGIPTEIGPFMRTKLISFPGKARAMMDLVLPKRTASEDESLGHFIDRRLGKEVLENIAEPLLAGIYAGDTYQLSLRATFPQFHTIEERDRSLILGMIKNRRQGGAESRTLPEAARNTTFLSFKEGLETVVHGLVDALDNVRFFSQCEALSVVKREDASYSIALSNGIELEADAVIAALPAYASAKLLGEHSLEARKLADINYVSVANIALAYNEDDVPMKLDGSGFVIPRNEGRFITASTWTSKKWLHTAPQGKILIRCYTGRQGDDRWLKMDEDEVIHAVRKDLKELMGIKAEPLFTEFTPLPRSMPQYPVGHQDMIDAVRSDLALHMPGVWVTGSAFHGVGLPDCVRQGKEAAAAVMQFVSE